MIPSEKLSQERARYKYDVIACKQQKDLPNDYKDGATILYWTETQELGIEAIIFQLQLKDISQHTIDLVQIAITHRKEIHYLVEKFKIFENYPFLDLFVIKILIAEILWGKQKLKIGSRETLNILYHEADLKEAFIETTTIFNSTEEPYTSKLPTYVRINTLSISFEDSIIAFIKEGWNLLPRPESYLDYVRIISHLRNTDFIRDFHISELLVFPIGTSFYDHPGYLKGKFLIQDKGSCLSSFLLNPKPGSHVLDMCAAPGLKTNHLANIINNEGIIYATDRHPDRYNSLCRMMDLTNATCVKPIFDDCINIKIEDLNYILVDVASTYSGIFHKRDATDLTIQLRYFNHLSSNILRYALTNFPSVKRVVFTTCSIFPEEGEKVVEDALKEVGNSYFLLDIKEMLRYEWTTTGQATEYSFADKCLRINPAFDMCQSYFIAVFERDFTKLPPIYVHRTDKPSEIIYDDSDDETGFNNNDDDDDEEITILFEKSPVSNKKLKNQLYY